MTRQRDERDGNGDGNQYDDDPLEELHATGPGPIGQFDVDTFERFQLAQNAGVPIFQVEALGYQAVHASEVLIP